MARMIGLLTDFGLRDPYVGQLHAVLGQLVPAEAVIDLWHHLPSFDARASAYLLPAYARGLPPGSVYVCVVDPGVGSSRPAVVLNLDGNWYVGPDNGLFAILWRRARARQCYVVDWRPRGMSASFHGRDLFAPAAAMLVQGEALPKHEAQLQVAGDDWPDELREVVYFDRYGNAMTGMRATSIESKSVLHFGKQRITQARTFADMNPGEAFWYENSNGLLEIAVNRASAVEHLGLRLGDTFAVVPSKET